ncbi:Alcohol dehydrogenase superfamily [Macleaya cordata]|uniref:Alcohol dehydrogenase superfamily n=1 Tax=Macleaya cordata TaxID=56857 RepID=A0A200PTV7_MACCD|nr:Alcohol dehydrogenase superfamily [Macleaya cordata]
MMKSAMMKLSFSKKKLVPLILFPKERKNLKFLVDLIKEGKMKTVVDSNYPLMEAEQAWAKMKGGHATGKIIIEP